MKQTRLLTALIEREDDMFVSLCPELGSASQGNTIEESHTNLKEALTLSFQKADPSKIAGRLHGEVFVIRAEVAVG